MQWISRVDGSRRVQYRLSIIVNELNSRRKIIDDGDELEAERYVWYRLLAIIQEDHFRLPFTLTHSTVIYCGFQPVEYPLDSSDGRAICRLSEV